MFLIDAGWNKETYWEYLKATLKNNGLEIKDLTAILLTHHHIDHIGLVDYIATKYNIPVYVHPYALPRLTGDPEFLYRSFLFFKDILSKLNTGNVGFEQIKARYNRQITEQKTALDWDLRPLQTESLFGFQVVPIPGHSPSQVGFYLPEEEIIFVGDLLIDHLRSNAFIEPALDGSRIKALTEHLESLERIIALNPKIALSGHGKVIDDPRKLAKRRIDAVEAKAQSIVTMIREGVSTGSEIVKQRHPDKYEKILLTLMSDMLTFLDYLEDRGDIKKEEVNGIWHWSANE